MHIPPGQPVRCFRKVQEAGESNGRQGEQESSKRSPGQVEREHVEEDEANVLPYHSFLEVCI